MPGQTDNYSIRYPCPGDTVTLADFTNWASDIDTALASVSELSDEALNRPRGMGRTANAGTAVAVGAGLTLLAATNTVYSHAMTNFSGVFVPESGLDGLFLGMATVIPVGTGTTVTSWKASLIMDNQTVASRTSASSAASTIAKPISLVGVGFLTSTGAGGLVQFEWTGTGGPMNVYAQLSFSYIAPAFP